MSFWKPAYAGPHAPPIEQLRQLAGETTPATTDADQSGQAVQLGHDQSGQPIVLPLDVRNRHVYVIGKSGSGKSSLIRNMILQDMRSGAGVIFLDPHGDTARDLLGYVPASRLSDVIYFCPMDESCPSFNPLSVNAPAYKLVDDLLSAFAMFFGFDTGSAPRLMHLMRNALNLLLYDRDNEAHTLADLKRVLTYEEYRERLLDRSLDQDTKDFWAFEWPRFSKDAALPILNKLSPFLASGSPLQRLFSGSTNVLDIAGAMDGSKILLCNLAKGELGESGAALVGGFLTTAIAQAALARASTHHTARRDVFFYVDEFQNFANGSFESILSEARKYRLNLTLAHQYLAQVPANLQSAIFGNVAALICLPISAADATTMKREMATKSGRVTPEGRTYSRALHIQQQARGWLRLFTHMETFPHGRYYGDSRPVSAFLSDADTEREQVTNAAGEKCGTVWEYFFRLRLADDGAKYLSDDFADRGYLTPASIHQAATDFLNDPERQTPLRDDLKAIEWPSSEDFGALQPLSGFVKIGHAASTRRFTFGHPQEAPSSHTAELVRRRQREAFESAKRTLDDARAKKLPAQAGQETRSPVETTLDTPLFDDIADEPVHFEHANTDDGRPSRRLPKPRRRS